MTDSAPRRLKLSRRMFRRVAMNSICDELEFYVSTVEAALLDRTKMLDSQKCMHDDLQYDEAERLIDEHNRKRFLMASSFPDHVRSTSFVYLYSSFEKQLLILASSVHKFANLPHPDTVKKHKGIVRAQRFFKDIARFNFPDTTTEWQEILLMGKMRNRFLHKAGISQLPPELLIYVAKHNKLIKTDRYSGSFVLRHGYCEHAIRVVRKFYLDLIESLPETLID